MRRSRPGRDDVAGHDLVARPQPHPPDPGRAATHRPDLGSWKRIAMPLRVTMKMSSVATGRHHSDELVVVAERDGDEALPARLVVLAEGRLLHLAELRREQQVTAGSNSLVGTIAWIVSSGASEMRFTTGVPRAVRSFMGISWARSRKTLPRLENSNRCASAVVWTDLADEVLLFEAALPARPYRRVTASGRRRRRPPLCSRLASA